jgi:hypothetical protein
MRKKKGDLAKIDALQIEALSDQELELVEGGVTDTTTHASCSCCVAGATVVVKPPAAN